MSRPEVPSPDPNRGWELALRVVHFVPYFPPDRPGGVGSYAHALHRGLLARGVDSRVVTQGAHDARETGVHRVGHTPLGWLIASLRWLGRAARADVVHCHTAEPLPLLLALALWPGRRARTVVTLHACGRAMLEAERPVRLAGRRFGPGFPAGVRRRASARLHRAADLLAVRLADATAAVSRATAVDLLGPVAGERLPVIHNGVATAAASDPGAPCELLYVGIHAHHKRTLALPFVLQAVRRRTHGARLRIAGFDAERAPELTRVLEELDLAAAVEFCGALAPEALPALYRAAQVVLLPSATEGLPYVLLEAMSHARPVVACRVGGIPEVVRDGVNGFLVPPDDPAAMAERASALLSDTASARRIGEAARRTVAERFGLERQVDAHLAYYRALAEGEP